MQWDTEIMENGDDMLVKGAIHNPDEPQHFMRIKPVKKVVTIMLNGDPVARTEKALRLMEVGRDVYDPVLYVPREDLLTVLERVPGKETLCPLKGTASYWRLEGQEKDIAWSYERPFDFAEKIAGFVAFDTSRVAIHEAPAGAG